MTASTPPLAIDLFCGLGGWTEGLIAEGYYVIGFDIERHEYGQHSYPGRLVIQDVLTLHGSQFRSAALIVASPPCQGYSYRAMPWKKAKALPPPDNTLFEACFRIQREACEAAGRHIPLVIENVRGAQPWVGRARWNFGSFYLWGDVPALMPIAGRVPAKRAMDDLKNGHRKLAHAHLPVGNGPLGRNDGTEGFKSSGLNWSDRSIKGQDFTRIAGKQALAEGVKQGGSGAAWWRDALNERRKAATAEGRKVADGGADGWFGVNGEHPLRKHHSKHPSRKAASALIAKIPLTLSRHIAATYLPRTSGDAA